MHNNWPNTIREALLRASSFLSTTGITDPMQIGEYLIRSYLGWDRTRFVISLEHQITSEQWIGILHWLERAASGEPIQYIVGQQEFYGETFTVSPSVLIPRPETELLIEHVLRVSDTLWDANATLRVIDLGTGSGAIPITLAKQRPNWKLVALDLSVDALKLAKSNAVRLEVSDKITFIEGSMLQIEEALENKIDHFKFDVVISNPPYIPSDDIAQLQREVRDHEPHMALDGGSDGLDFYRGICKQLSDILAAPSVVAFEVGIGQAAMVAKMLHDAGAKQTNIYPDFQSIERVVIGIFET